MIPKPMLVVAGLLLVAALPTRVQAHHVVSEHGIAPVLPKTIASLDAAAGTFEAGGQRGNWQLFTPSFEWKAFERLSLFAALPLGRVRFDDGRSEVGLGDVSLSVKASVFETAHGGLLISVGLGFELPTGDSDKGLGGGHMELAPFIGLSSAFFESGPLSLISYGLSALSVSLAGGDDHHAGPIQPRTDTHGSVFAPHAARELYGRAMLAAVVRAFHLGIGGEGSAVLQRAGGGHGGLRAEAGCLVTPAVRVMLAGDLTVLGEKRYGARGRVGVAWLF